MIDKHELRISNKVSLAHESLIVTISKIGYSEVEFDNYNLRYDYEDLMPIPISVELIDKCGLQRWGKHKFHVGKVSWYIDKYTIIVFCDDTYDQWWEIRFLDSKENRYFKISSFHELQNWYYLLEQKELTIL